MNIPAEVSRRIVLKLLASSAAACGIGCGQPESPREGLARLLELEGEEVAWLDVLNDLEQRDLYEGLSGGQVGAPRTIQLLARVIQPRSRLFAFVGYPTLTNSRTVCDGLVRE